MGTTGSPFFSFYSEGYPKLRCGVVCWLGWQVCWLSGRLMTGWLLEMCSGACSFNLMA